MLSKVSLNRPLHLHQIGHNKDLCAAAAGVDWHFTSVIDVCFPIH
jgi:hypothetical protein